MIATHIARYKVQETGFLDSGKANLQYSFYKNDEARPSSYTGWAKNRVTKKMTQRRRICMQFRVMS